MDEITQINGMWMAKEIETSPIQCAINRDRRIRALNYIIFDDSYEDDPYCNWIAIPGEYQDTNLVCICGKKIDRCDILSLRDEPDVKVCIGSECVKRVGSGDINTDFYAYYKKQKKTCPDCKGPKCIKYKYCGDSVCSKCVHGQRTYQPGPYIRDGLRKSAWVCPLKRWGCDKGACVSLYVQYSERAPITKSTKPVYFH